MVDCGGLRCAQERRSFKKDLLSWGKKIPVLIGLEAVALEIGGHDLISQLLEPFNCLETDEVTDWEPNENCFYCNTKITDPGSELNEDGTKKVHSGFKCTPELMPYCPQYYTQNAQMDPSHQPLDLSSNGYCLDNVPSPGSAWELDLVSKPHVELKIPQIIMQAGKCKKDSHLQNGKKAYTEEELVTAVTEIRSGKLGTRRAAVLYGIPRSTLRNKIFKMETEEQQQQQQQQQQQPPPAAAVVMNTELECSEDSQHSDGAIGHSHRLTVAGTDPLHLSPYSILFPPLVGGILSCQHDFGSQTEDDWEKKLEQIRRKHNLNGATLNLSEKPLPLTSNNGKSSNACPEFKLPLLHDLVRKMTEQRLLIEQSASQIRSPVALESLRHLQEGNNNNQHSNGSSSSNHINSQLAESTPSYALMSLKIPSYRPAKAQNHPDTLPTTITTSAANSNDTTEVRPYDSMKIGEALKDIIVKTISEKVYKRKHQADSYSSTQDENHPGNNNNNNCKSYSSSSLMAAGTNATPAKKLKKSAAVEKKLESSSSNNNSSSNVDSGNKPVKKTRPKRGQYRKYNSQLLMEAVRAVQRGEMSVHRAGSYYGVPHSTLEYKVKERHLLRQKKIKESQLQKDNSGNASAPDDPGITKAVSLTSGTATTTRASSSSSSSNNNKNNNISTNSNNNTANPTSSNKSGGASASSSSSSSSTASVSIKSETSSSAGSPGSGNGKTTGAKFDCKSLNTPWLQPYANGSPQYDSSGMNLFNSSFALSTPASELLRKLQHKVQSKSNAFAQDSNFLSGTLSRPNGMSPLGNSFLFIN